jgi:hypothetical protein
MVTTDAPAVLVEEVQIDSDPHQSPFGIKAMGLLHWGVDTRPLALSSPRKSSVPRQGPSGPRGGGVGPGGGPSWVRVALTRPHRSVGSQIAGSVP